MKKWEVYTLIDRKWSVRCNGKEVAILDPVQEGTKTGARTPEDRERRIATQVENLLNKVAV